MWNSVNIKRASRYQISVSWITYKLKNLPIPQQWLTTNHVYKDVLCQNSTHRNLKKNTLAVRACGRPTSYKMCSVHCASNLFADDNLFGFTIIIRSRMNLLKSPWLMLVEWWRPAVELIEDFESYCNVEFDLGKTNETNIRSRQYC